MQAIVAVASSVWSYDQKILRRIRKGAFRAQNVFDKCHGICEGEQLYNNQAGQFGRWQEYDAYLGVSHVIRIGTGL
jgi:hypothetical protein